ncbi:MAG: beta-ketoacyl synthase chain length factor [Deltaproteobacteria bacterium]|nr:beta-ketoacyl synthase chain length factor [Deltaproteobacteria bacterium]
MKSPVSTVPAGPESNLEVNISSVSMCMRKGHVLYELDQDELVLKPVQDSVLGGIPFMKHAPGWMQRRLTMLSRMFMRTVSRCMERLDIKDEQAPLCFATSNGEINVVGKIMADLLGKRHRISPSDFQNSVYNAPTGYFAIATDRKFASNTIARGNLTFEYGLLDAVSRLACGERNVLLVAGDEAISTKWAEPAHSSLDLCGALWLSTAKDLPVLAKIAGIHHFKPRNQSQRREFENSLIKKNNARILRDHKACNGPCSLDEIDNPSAGIAHLLLNMKRDFIDQAMLISRSDIDQDMMVLSVEPK